MKNLWAPWRMKFIEDLRNKGTGCIFCELQAQTDDSENLVLCRCKHSYVVMNRYPYNNGHLLIVPYRHEELLSSLSKEEQTELMYINAQAIDILIRELGAEGVNGGINIGRAAGAGITDHVHLHLVPRWNGDSNFLPIFSDTRSMPEYLDNTYQKLVKSFKELEQKGES